MKRARTAPAAPAKVDHTLRYADAHPRLVSVHTDDGARAFPCTGLLSCETCGLTVAQVQVDPRELAPRAAYGIDLESLAFARRAPGCEVRT